MLENWNNDEIVLASYNALKSEFSPFSDVRASSEYRLRVTANLVKKSLLILKGLPLENLAHYSVASKL
jgi:xanthine dehydrogenase small subunit